MKVSDAIAKWLAEHGVRHVFTVSGGANLHIIHSISKTEGIEYVCPQNEQAAAFAADSYARLVGIGCALATSGPGATNLITGISASYYDSVPVIYITGNQSRNRLVSQLMGNSLNRPRQYGFQETPIAEICRPITKWASTLMEPQNAILNMDWALAAAMTGRRGPVLIDIPDDVQRCEI